METRLPNVSATANISKTQPTGEASEPILPFKEYLDSAKARYLDRLLDQSGGNVGEACRLSGLSRAYLYQLIQKFRKSSL
jgi:two-component system NtrC family response regulator